MNKDDKKNYKASYYLFKSQINTTWLVCKEIKMLRQFNIQVYNER